MTRGFNLQPKRLEDAAISPLNELGAYEALWSSTGTTFKTIADLFRKNPQSVPSDFVEPKKRLEYAEKALRIVKKAGVHRFGIRVHGAGEYPPKLRDAAHPIELLYFRGWWDLVSTRSIAVVGTREATDEGIIRTRRLVKSLVERNYTVVSGLAKGIDTAAHKMAIELGGRTIAVIATPISQAFPTENKDLQEMIAENFLVISQVPICRYAINFAANRYFFPERNITMSALTEATIIVEASDTSGTLVQARAALHQGRKLFILDSCFKNPAITWPARFAEKGAIRVVDFADIEKNLDSSADKN